MFRLAFFVSSMSFACTLWLSGCGCASQRSAPAEAHRTPANLEPAVEEGGDWRMGPRVDSREELEAWIVNLMDQTASPRPLVRVPVLISFDESRLAVSSAYVGALPGVKRGIEVVLDDSALGVSLLSRLQPGCAMDESTCLIWVEGHWGSLLRLDENARPHGPPYPLTVRRLLERKPGDGTHVLQSTAG
jgi:hypothetical protein